MTASDGGPRPASMGQAAAPSLPRPDSYSSVERRFLEPVRHLLAWACGPLVAALVRFGVAPNTVSLVGPLLGVLFVFTVRQSRLLGFVIWIPSMLVDGVDGALARHTGRASTYGALVDQFADHTREILVIAGLAASGALSPLWGSLYPFVYTALNVTLLMGNMCGAPVPVAVKSWLVLYPAIAVYLLGGRNYLNPAAALSVTLMALTIVHGLALLSRAMDAG